MMQKQHEAMAHQRSAPRWKEWIPLVTQQLRLRNIIQVIAYNIGINGETTYDLKANWGQLQKPCKMSWSTDNTAQKSKTDNKKLAFYYTLHLTTMSAPFYTSEKLESENPKWEEIEISDLIGNVNSAVNGIVIRLWLHRKQEKDVVLTVWGAYFNGLVYLGPRLSSDLSSFCINTIVFRMPGGYFTAPECFKEQPQKFRNTRVCLNHSDVRPSYTVGLLLRLHTIQQAIKKQMHAAQSLREKIAHGGLVPIKSRESESLFKLLNASQPNRTRRQEFLKLKREIEKLKFKVALLSQEKRRKQEQLLQIEKINSALAYENQDRGTNLIAKYEILYKETEQLKEWRKSQLDAREAFLHVSAQLNFRRRQLISELSFIYPIVQESVDRFTIAGVHLPNSEDFTSHEESMISVALGYVAHVVQMISIFLQIPLRYPVIHFGSRSKIMDHISEKIPDKDREFPLFSRGKDKLQFNYGVYLLNKNIAQLRWFCGLPTQDLRTTLSNLTSLLQLGAGTSNLEATHHTVSSSSLDLRSSSQNVSSPGSSQTVFRRGHRVSKSMGSTELHFQVHTKSNVSSSIQQNGKSLESNIRTNEPPVTSNNLSYSLDKGLDEYREMKKSENSKISASSFVKERVTGSLGHVGSEPILSNRNKYQHAVPQENEATSSADEEQKKFLQNWEAHGPAPICSDDDGDILQAVQLSSQLPAANFGREVNEENSNVEHNKNIETEIVSDNVLGNSLTSSKLETKSECRVKHDNYHTKNDESENQLQLDISDRNQSYHSSNTMTVEQNSTFCRKNKEKCRNDPGTHYMFSQDESAPVTVCGQRLDSEMEGNSVNLSEVGKIAGNTVLDNIFENVAIRTEALASRSASFNLVKSRHSSMIED